MAHPAADQETERLLKALERMAERLDGRFVADPEKVRIFTAAAAAMRERAVTTIRTPDLAD